MKIFLIIIISATFGLITSCKKDNNDINTSISGEITYNGVYTGQNNTIYIRAYTSNSNAIGTPDYITSIPNTGSFSIDLGGYQGDLYLSAFMDVDTSGSPDGPTANDVLIDGVYADPSGCYGDYTFENGGPIKINIDGDITGINIELKDNGVIKASFSNTGHCTFGVIKNNIISEVFLHHRHCDVISSLDTFLLAVPAKDSWYCKVKFDNLPTAQVYSNPIHVISNSINEINF